jgi:hypothetical protein
MDALMLHHRPRVIERVAVAAKTRTLTGLLFQFGMNPNLAGWLGVTPLPDNPSWATPIALARHRGHDRIIRLLE